MSDDIIIETEEDTVEAMEILCTAYSSLAERAAAMDKREVQLDQVAEMRAELISMFDDTREIVELALQRFTSIYVLEATVKLQELTARVGLEVQRVISP